MKNSASEQSFYIESEGEEDENYKYGDGDGDGSDSEHSNYSNDDDDNDNANHESKTAWPQSYRQTMDLYGTVPSPSLTFLGPPIAITAGELVLVIVPREEAHSRQATFICQALLPHLRKAVLDKRASIAQEPPVSYQSTYGQAVLNGLYERAMWSWNTFHALCYQRRRLARALYISSFCVSLLLYWNSLRHCLDSQPDLETYPDIGQAAFGITGRIIISIILYVELYVSTFRNSEIISYDRKIFVAVVHFGYIGLHNFMSINTLFAESSSAFCRLVVLTTTLAVLPTVWLRDLSILSYLSAGGVLASTLVVVCLFWVGTVDGVNVHAPGTAINLSSLPVAIGLYGYCYSGHAVFPNIYSSMQKPSEYPAVLLTSFGLCTLMYAGAAIMGYYMFGDGTKSQFTLNMPNNLVASKLAVWTTHPILWSGECIDRILSHDASYVDSSVCLLFEHPKRQTELTPASLPDYAGHWMTGSIAPSISNLKSRRESWCVGLMNCQKLSIEASTNAAQNEMLPLRVTMQVLFFEQLRLRSYMAGWFVVSDTLGGGSNERPSAVNSVGGLDVGLTLNEVRARVSGLEKKCDSIKHEIRKVTKGRWINFYKRGLV
ncbi:hypothetical protein SASPL_151225 [Salvia splendens]|uniref:NPH3 domain-containing protein n=1 Tax=Salvia splendens TaxID=180675 RepID=A0A8X8W7K5_SALSN|nr:hypothetical protein SASPL_151225 [Salvia splendens]